MKCRFCDKKEAGYEILGSRWKLLPQTPVMACREHFEMWAAGKDEELQELLDNRIRKLAKERNAPIELIELENKLKKMKEGKNG